jgi:putative flippase GtrA
MMPQLEIVVPVRNEEHHLVPSVRRLVAYLRESFPFTTRVTIADTGWFFDTELLVLAERAGPRIHEVPVDWVDDADSRVDIVATALADLRGVARLGIGLSRGTIKVPAPAGEGSGGRRPNALSRQLVRFALIGVASTAAYIALYLVLRTSMPAQAANAVSLLITAIGNTAANRRVTFGIRGRGGTARHQVRGLIAFGLGLALTSGALASLHALAGSPGRGLEIAVLVVANLAATALRFGLYRSWVFEDPAIRRKLAPVPSLRHHPPSLAESYGSLQQ